MPVSHWVLGVPTIAAHCRERRLVLLPVAAPGLTCFENGATDFHHLAFQNRGTVILAPFPTLIDAPERWQWPVPPFAWRHVPPPDNHVAQTCRIESQVGSAVAGQMSDFNPQAGTLGFRTTVTGPVVTLPFSRFRRLTLTTPLQPARKTAGAPVERVPAAAQERKYTLVPTAGEPLTGRTAGHVTTPQGIYLFTPVNDEASLLRVFVPRSAYATCQFGASAEEVATHRWCGAPEALLDAIARQQTLPIRPVGESLLALGLVTPDQLERALVRQSGTAPLGEALVADGVISRSDLQTALAHKMGFPLVDLARFPIDEAAVTKLPHRIAVGYRVMPLLLDKTRLIVAVDKPSRAMKLNALQAYAQLTIVPVLAPRTQILLALERLSKDVWSQNVSQRPAFFATTI